MAEPPLRAALAALAEGDVEGVAAAYQSWLDQGDPRLASEWLMVLMEAGLLEQADDLRRHQPGLPEVATWDALLPTPALEDVVLAEEDLAALELAAPERPQKDPIVHAFIRWFGGRRDLYARQWYDERRRRSGYRPVEEPLLPNVARAHLEGRLTLGQYLLFPDGTVSFAAIDIDLEPNSLADHRAANGPSATAANHPAVRSAAEALLATASSLGVPLFPEDSGNRGVHLWLLFSPRRPAAAARQLLRILASRLSPLPPEVGLEIFPKQSRPGARGLSSLIKLPLGIHQVTLQPCPLLDDALRPIADPVAALARLRHVPDALVTEILGGRLVPLGPAHLSPADPPPPLPASSGARGLAEVLRAMAAPAEERDACDRMLQGCGVLRHLASRAYAGEGLAPDEARGLSYTLGLVGHGRLAEEVLVAARASRKELDRVRRSLPNPSGCRKLGRLAPQHCTGPCFPPGASPYATPALFATGLRDAAEAPAPFADLLGPEAFSEPDPLDVIARILRRIEEKLTVLQPPSTDEEPS